MAVRKLLVVVLALPSLVALTTHAQTNEKIGPGLIRNKLRQTAPRAYDTGEAVFTGSAHKLRRSPIGQRVLSMTPVVHHVGWWSHQDEFELSALRIEELDHMHFLHPECTICISISGEITRRHVIKEFYIREQFREVNNGRRIVEIVVVPVVGWEDADDNAPERSVVQARADYTLHAYQWGDNDYKIVCGPLTRDVRCHYTK